ncbi:hypothetical protein PTKIN_Ptkin12aG0115700 [Pterospermum kingtungense]
MSFKKLFTKEDLEKLNKAFQGPGTYEDRIIEILGHRDASQRKKIREAYQQLYNESLIDTLNSELFGDYGKAIILWTYDLFERDAISISEALKSKKKGVKIVANYENTQELRDRFPTLNLEDKVSLRREGNDRLKTFRVLPRGVHRAIASLVLVVLYFLLLFMLVVVVD